MFDIGDKAHIKHPVSFIDNQQLATIEQNLAAFEQVHQPARSSDQNIDALFQRLDLVAHLNTADQQSHR